MNVGLFLQLSTLLILTVGSESLDVIKTLDFETCSQKFLNHVIKIEYLDLSQNWIAKGSWGSSKDFVYVYEIDRNGIWSPETGLSWDVMDCGGGSVCLRHLYTDKYLVHQTDEEYLKVGYQALKSKLKKEDKYHFRFVCENCTSEENVCLLESVKSGKNGTMYGTNRYASIETHSVWYPHSYYLVEKELKSANEKNKFLVKIHSPEWKLPELEDVVIYNCNNPEKTPVTRNLEESLTSTTSQRFTLEVLVELSSGWSPRKILHPINFSLRKAYSYVSSQSKQVFSSITLGNRGIMVLPGHKIRIKQSIATYGPFSLTLGSQYGIKQENCTEEERRLWK